MTIEFSVLNSIYVNIGTHVYNRTKYEDMCVAGVIRELLTVGFDGLLILTN